MFLGWVGTPFLTLPEAFTFWSSVGEGGVMCTSAGGFSFRFVFLLWTYREYDLETASSMTYAWITTRKSRRKLAAMEL